jgi:hypothetical protein
MSNMKLIMESWKGYLTENEQNWVTWRMLSDTIELIKAEKAGEETKERQQKLLKLGGKSLLKLAASLTGPIGALVDIGMESAEVIGGMVKAYAQAPDSQTKQNPFLDLFNLDDGFEDLIDDEIEDQFVNKMLKDIPDHVQKHPDQVIPDFDKVVQAWLPTLNLSGTTNNNVMKTGD